MDEIRDVLGGNWEKAVLFLKGNGLNENNIDRQENDIAKAVMINHDMINDPFVRKSIYQLICNRIDEAKIGVIKVHGNFSIASGDLYALCQSMFGLEVTGILKAGEIYNGYWDGQDATELVCFRAPMTTHENIRHVYPVNRDDVSYWYQYMQTCTVFNAWDTAMSALNGMDFDGDLVMLTDNPVLVRCHKELPALMCAQRKAEKRISNEEDFIKSNIDSFGNEIGQTTNWVTSMFEVRSRFEPESEEYKILTYRIQCGQLYQQNAIDKAKGIICKPMPRAWYDRYTINKIGDDNTKTLYRSIIADKKPYFMIYIYPALMKQYNQFMKNTNRNSLREFQLTIDELKAIPQEELTASQSEFLKYFDHRMPVGTSDCVINKICHRFEEEFDGYIKKYKDTADFDYTIMKSDTDYTPVQFYNIKSIYENYNQRLKNYMIFSNYERIDKYDSHLELVAMTEEFRAECSKICPNEKALCNIVLDLCYRRSSTKKFAWDICGDAIISNLLTKNNNTISFPKMSADGEIQYCGNSYTIETKELEVVDDYT